MSGFRVSEAATGCAFIGRVGPGGEEAEDVVVLTRLPADGVMRAHGVALSDAEWQQMIDKINKALA